MIHHAKQLHMRSLDLNIICARTNHAHAAMPTLQDQGAFSSGSIFGFRFPVAFDFSYSNVGFGEIFTGLPGGQLRVCDIKIVLLGKQKLSYRSHWPIYIYIMISRALLESTELVRS